MASTLADFKAAVKTARKETVSHVNARRLVMDAKWDSVYLLPSKSEIDPVDSVIPKELTKDHCSWIGYEGLPESNRRNFLGYLRRIRAKLEKRMADFVAVNPNAAVHEAMDLMDTASAEALRV